MTKKQRSEFRAKITPDKESLKNLYTLKEVLRQLGESEKIALVDEEIMERRAVP